METLSVGILQTFHPKGENQVYLKNLYNLCLSVIIPAYRSLRIRMDRQAWLMHILGSSIPNSPVEVYTQ